MISCQRCKCTPEHIEVAGVRLRVRYVQEMIHSLHTGNNNSCSKRQQLRGRGTGIHLHDVYGVKERVVWNSLRISFSDTFQEPESTRAV